MQSASRYAGRLRDFNNRILSLSASFVLSPAFPRIYCCPMQFLGQMFAPGAIPERLAMGTLEGLRHREYVEGRDEDYITSSLVAADCAFTVLARYARILGNCLLVDPCVRPVLDQAMKAIRCSVSPKLMFGQVRSRVGTLQMGTRFETSASALPDPSS